MLLYRKIQPEEDTRGKISVKCLRLASKRPSFQLQLSAPKYLCDTTVHFLKLFDEDLTYKFCHFLRH